MGVLDDAQRGPGAVDFLANPAYMGQQGDQIKQSFKQAHGHEELKAQNDAKAAQQQQSADDAHIAQLSAQAKDNLHDPDYSPRLQKKATGVA